jgi:hypothetical protein
VYLYALKDPITQEVRYVGQSNQPLRRLAEHLTDHQNNQAKAAWIEDLRSQNKEPLIEILEEVQGKDTPEREVWWIAHYQWQGHHLTNHSLKHEALWLNASRVDNALIDPELTPLERAQRLDILQTISGWSIGELCQRLGRSPPIIRRYLALLRLPDTVTAALHKNSRVETIRVAATIATTFSSQDTMAAAWEVVSGLKSREAEAIIEASKGNLEWLKAQAG